MKFNKETIEYIKKFLEDIFKMRGKPVNASIVKKYCKRFASVLNKTKKDSLYEYEKRLSREVGGTSNAKFIINGNVEEAKPDYVRGQIVATQIYVVNKAIEYGYKANITSLGFLELLDGDKEYYIEADSYFRYTINKSTLEHFVETNEIPSEILKNELAFLKGESSDFSEDEEELGDISEYYVE